MNGHEENYQTKPGKTKKKRSFGARVLRMIALLLALAFCVMAR